MKNHVKELRKSKGLRQEDLAAAAGVSRLALAMKLARHLGSTVEELFILEE